MSVYKEFLILKRDIGGVIILFVMPLVLIITVTLIQDTTFKKVNDVKIPILLVDNDNGKVSQSVSENLQKSEAFAIVTQIDNQKITEAIAKEAVFKGKFQLAIVIPKNLSVDLQSKINQNVDHIVSSFSEADTTAKANPKVLSQKEVKLYFDPAVQISFKNAVMSAIDKMISHIETQSIYATFQKQLGEDVVTFEQKSFITLK
jgi:ABC-2 type transport system permease protein